MLTVIFELTDDSSGPEVIKMIWVQFSESTQQFIAVCCARISDTLNKRTCMQSNSENY